jgi:hypothetical protein
MSKPKLIGLMGRMGTGKSTVADILHVEYGYQRSKFSQTLKDMMLCIPGVTDEMIEGRLKEVPNMIFGGRTPRYAMQKLGTEWGRDMMDPDIWVDSWHRRVEAYSSPISVEDVRFHNEANKIRELGGEIWLIKRKSKIFSEHSSELDIEHIRPDYTFRNYGTKLKLSKLIGEHFVYHPANPEFVKQVEEPHMHDHHVKAFYEQKTNS